MRDQIGLALTRYRAGNTTGSNWVDVASYFNSTFGTSQSITAVGIFDLSGVLVYFTSVNVTGRFEDKLFPPMIEDPANLPSVKRQSAYIAGPLYNQYDESYLMSMTFPVMGNTTIFVDSAQLSGYVSVVFKTESFRAIINDTTGLDDHGMMYLFGGINMTADHPTVKALLPATNTPTIIPGVHGLDEVPAVDLAIKLKEPGSIIKSHVLSQYGLAVGYSLCKIFSVLWVVVITEPHSAVYAPIDRLRNIAIVAGVAALVFCTVVIIGCVHLGVQPIYRLKQAAEQTTISFHESGDDPSSTSYSDKDERRGSQSSKSKRQSLLSKMFGWLIRDNNTTQSSRGSPNEGVPVSPMLENGTEKKRMLVPARVKILEYRFFSDELVSLQYSFNRMADELEKQYNHLEDIVIERTKELEKAKQEAENANEAKSMFIANITHELRTPLNGILGMTAVSMTETDLTKISRSLKVIARSGMLLMNLLNDLLMFSKNQIGKTRLEETSFCLSDIYYQLENALSDRSEDIEYEVGNNGQGSDVIEELRMGLYGDLGRIVQILFHLVSNGLKFGPEGSKVIVRMQCVAGNYHHAIGSNIDNYNFNMEVNSNNNGSQAIPMSSVSSSQTFSSASTSTSTNHLALNLVGEISNGNSFSSNATNISNLNSGRHSNSTALSNRMSLSTPTHTRQSVGTNSSIQHSNYEESGSDDPDQVALIFEPPLPVWFQFQVEDNGPGVDLEKTEELFEPFVQGDQALSRRHGGAGLGLSICKQLVGLMGGTIALCNRNQNPASGENGGLIVTVRLPLKQTSVLKQPKDFTPPETSERGSVSIIPEFMLGDDSPSVTKVSNPSRSKSVVTSYFDYRHGSSNTGGTGGKVVTTPITPGTVTISTSEAEQREEDQPHILIAEDNIINQEILKRMLMIHFQKLRPSSKSDSQGGDNFTTTSDIHTQPVTPQISFAMNGEHAIAKAEERMRSDKVFDLIFMDLQMPRMDGLEATKRLREMGYLNPIVALTGFVDDDNRANDTEGEDLGGGVAGRDSRGLDGWLEKPIVVKKLDEILDKFLGTRWGNRAAGSFHAVKTATPAASLGYSASVQTPTGHSAHTVVHGEKGPTGEQTPSTPL